MIVLTYYIYCCLVTQYHIFELTINVIKPATADKATICFDAFGVTQVTITLELGSGRYNYVTATSLTCI